MTPSDARWDRFTHTKVGRFVIHPMFIVGMAIFMVVNAAVAGWALTTAWDAKGREIQVARTEASRAVVKAQQAQDAQRAASDVALVAARRQFCAIINIISGGPPPTNERSLELQQAFQKLGTSAFLHCDQP